MGSEGGYREDDLAKRVEGLRAERDALLHELHGAQRTLEERPTSGWWLFFVGLSITPGLFDLWLLH